MKVNIIACATLLLFSLACKKEDSTDPTSQDVIQDKQVRFDFQFGSNISSTSDATTGTILPEQVSILRFNINNYSEVDSVIFCGKIWSGNSSNQAYAELYNITDNQVIANSLIATTSTTYLGHYVFSTNIKDKFPNKEITLGIRIKTQTEGVAANIYRANLFIYK